MKPRKHKAEIIEMYPGTGTAAVQFSTGRRKRIEEMLLYSGPDCLQFKLGMKGWASYTSTPFRGTWGFTPFKEIERLSAALGEVG